MFMSGTTSIMAAMMRSPFMIWLRLNEKSISEMTFRRSMVFIHALKSSSLPAAYMPPTSAPMEVPATEVIR